MKNKPNTQEYTSEAIVQRLDALISLLIDPLEKPTVYDKAARLRLIGLKYSEIARILGKSETHISKELSVGNKVNSNGRQGNRAKA